ncbi:MAG: UDP-N-acetylglucosamine 1-carboxyvinyltransferase, partial [Clostridia bacterium]|nr:UDP-N-acetylglucosamine 1-carboxyvinyltransferase [Clostridia bacterium]
IVIQGGSRLTGVLNISGAKNSAVGVIPAAVLSSEKCIIKNLPDIKDVIYLKELLLSLGATVEMEGTSTMIVDSSTINNFSADYESAKQMRASYYFIGALLGRFKKAEVPFPGGCDIGVRPIDQHIKGFEALGAKVTIEHGIIKVEAEELIGAPIYMDVVSVGATINIMLAASRAKGITTIENAAKEPYIVDVANFLNAMGANVKGAGTDIIKIKGVDDLKGCEHTIIPDFIEAGTYMVAAAATRGDVTLTNVIPTHLEAISAKMKEMGIEIHEYEDSIRIKCDKKPKAVNIKTLPYPGFPTDIQQPMSVLLSMAEGTSIVSESIWEGRFKYVDELKRMGAKVKVEDRIAVIEGIDKLLGTSVYATDLRAGAAMVVAGLVAEGETIIGNIKHIDRGYEFLEDKLASLGANIKRIKLESD